MDTRRQDDMPIEKSTDEARAAVTGQGVRYVLGFARARLRHSWSLSLISALVATDIISALPLDGRDAADLQIVAATPPARPGSILPQP